MRTHFRSAIPQTPIQFTPPEVSTYFRVRLARLKQSRADQWRGPCPVHGGTDDNFAVDAATGRAYCHSRCGRGWDLIGLEMELSGKDFKAAKAGVFRIVGRTDEPKELKFRDRIETAYDYTDERGELLYQIVRLHSPKDFCQRQPDGKGDWIWKKNPRQVLYKLPEVIAAPIVFVAEGEKDAESLRSYGFVGTTNAGGRAHPGWRDIPRTWRDVK